jgi:hypothetical protein
MPTSICSEINPDSSASRLMAEFLCANTSDQYEFYWEFKGIDQFFLDLLEPFSA